MDAEPTDNGDIREGILPMQESFPKATAALSGWLAELEDLPELDHRTKELVRLACTTILRHGPGVQRHARLAAEFGCTREEVIGVLMLTQPGFGLVPARQMLPFALEGFEAGSAARAAGTGAGTG
jgi:alkylhydroperoxidase/carboxymuconolactone decarboxylase family protein YurZ